MDDNPTSFLEHAKQIASQTRASHKRETDEAQQEKLECISQQLHRVTQTLKDDVLCETRGELGDAGQPLGYLEYRLKNACGDPESFSSAEFEGVKGTSGYLALAQLCTQLGVKIALTLEKYEHPVPHYHTSAMSYHFYVQISGWY